MLFKNYIVLERGGVYTVESNLPGLGSRRDRKQCRASRNAASAKNGHIADVELPSNYILSSGNEKFLGVDHG